jgi:glutathione S-transferase
MPPIEILGLARSDFVWAARLACAEKGVPHVLVPADPGTPEVLEIHPLGKVPVLRHGAVRIFESRAICGYVDAAFDGPPLMPREPAAAALAEQWVSLLVTCVEPVLVRRLLFARIFPGTPDGAPDAARIDAALPEAERHLAALDAAVADGFVGGGRLTLADVYAAPILASVAWTPEASGILARLPRLAGYLARMLDRPAARETAPPADG